MKGLDGILKCSPCYESFNTPTEFYEHEKEKDHTHTGSTLCLDCKEAGIIEHCEIDSTDKHRGRPTARCSTCENKLLDKLEKRQKDKKK